MSDKQIFHDFPTEIKALRDEINELKDLYQELLAENLVVVVENNGLTKANNELRSENTALWMLNTGIKKSCAELEEELARIKPSWNNAPEWADVVTAQWIWYSEGHEPARSMYAIDYRPVERK